MEQFRAVLAYQGGPELISQPPDVTAKGRIDLTDKISRTHTRGS